MFFPFVEKAVASWNYFYIGLKAVFSKLTDLGDSVLLYIRPEAFFGSVFTGILTKAAWV